MSEERIKDTFAKVEAMAKVWEENIAVHLGGTPYGQRLPNDEQFVAWFQLMRARDPDWVRALPYIENGTKELLRYLKLTGLYQPAEAAGQLKGAMTYVD